jgi:hypothetical protein
MKTEDGKKKGKKKTKEQKVHKKKKKEGNGGSITGSESPLNHFTSLRPMRAVVLGTY